jgi:ribosome recycling factor
MSVRKGAKHLVALLDGVKVALPDSPSTPLNTVASVTVKSNTLFIEVWDTDVRAAPPAH